MFVARHAGHHLIADFGEVGNKGRGGHGHNDTFSFVLSLSGRAVIVDPGSPVYTGDLVNYERFRSTSFHNTLAVDGEEMARLLDVFRVSDEAKPHTVTFESGDEFDVVSGSHDGYRRLSDPVRHSRRLSFWKRRGRLVCYDALACKGGHRVRRFLHVAPGLEARLEGTTLVLAADSRSVATILWTPGTHARLDGGLFSRSYGHSEPACVLVLEDEIHGPTQLSFEIGSS
jgi:hypothetical protein